MRMAGWFVAWFILLVGVSALWGAEMAFEYPSALLDAYDADESCWTGIGLLGEYPAAAMPQRWLVGPPPSGLSAVTVPTDHWVHLLFSGEITRADGDDVKIFESGAAGEQSLVFLTDGADQEYALGTAEANGSGGEILSEIGVELPGMPMPFVPRGLRIVALDHGGTAPGFDVAYVQAWVSRECGPGARCPNPVDGAVSVRVDATLSWIPACAADEQVVYLGPDVQAVRSALPQTRYALDVPDANRFEPPLQLGKTYYWRVAEANDAEANDSHDVQSDDVWSFTVADHLLIDDFEDYVDGGPSVYEAWYSRDRARPSVERTVFRTCPLAMAFEYYYDNFYLGSYSEVYHVFSQPQDWTRAGIEVLEFWLYGDPGNATNGQMYLALSDGGSEQIVLYGPDTEILTEPDWHACRVALAEFTDVNLASVTSVGIGFRLPAGLPAQSGSGTITLDDILLRPAFCPEDRRPDADLNADCAVDYRDLEQLACEWLRHRVRVVAVAAPNEPVLWYKFDGDTLDSAAAAHGQVEGRPTYPEGKHGRAIRFANADDSVVVSQASSVFGPIREALTIAFWQCGDDSGHLNDTICCSNYVYGESNPSIAIHLGCWRDPGQYRWDCGTPWSIENRVAGRHVHKSEWARRWNHWAFIKDAAAGRMEIYLNGTLYDSRSGTDTPIEGITSFEIGSGWYGHYDGLIDDFQIYDYALSAAEVAYLASDATGVLEQAVTPAADLNGSGRVDIGDYAVLATEWLADQLLP